LSDGSELLNERVRKLEVELSLPTGFMERLKDEDDWSFIIKAHALLEALLTHLIVTVLDREELRNPIASLNVVGSRTGKVVFAVALGALGDSEARFIQRLTGLRNRLVHDVSKVSFSLTDYVEKLEDGQCREFVKEVAYPFLQMKSDDAELLGALKTLTLKLPKFMIWSSMSIAAHVLFATKDAYAEKITDSQLLATMLTALKTSAREHKPDRPPPRTPPL
jgi:hypothetical protein